VLKYRLILGPIFVLAALFLSWLDGWLDAQPAPEFLRRFGVQETWPPGLLIFLVVAMMAVVAACELTRILKSKNVAASKRMNSILAVSGLLLGALIPEEWSGVGAAGLINASVALVLIVSLVVYSRKQQVEGMIAAAGGSLLSFCYLGLLFAFMIMIRREHPVWVMLWVLLVTKSCDIGAFFTGISIGRHKLIPWLSPGKTWEGLIGGLITSAAVAAGGAMLLPLVCPEGTPLPGWRPAIVAGLLFGAVGQLGDLLASLLKRDAGVKDAGKSLPGFGGMLDLIDSVVLVGPFAFWWLRLAATG